jgi:hypothetical protein
MNIWPWMLDRHEYWLRKAKESRFAADYRICELDAEISENKAQRAMRSLNSYELKLKMLGAV